MSYSAGMRSSCAELHKKCSQIRHRLDIAAGDWHAVKAGLKAAAELCENGGDWERKNRLKVYDATFRLATRDLAGAAGLLLDSIATFTSCGPLSPSQPTEKSSGGSLVLVHLRALRLFWAVTSRVQWPLVIVPLCLM